MKIKFNYTEMLYHVYEVDLEVSSIEEALEKIDSDEIVLDLTPDTVVESVLMLEGISDESREVLVVNKRI